MATGFPTKANWVSGDILTAAQMDDLAGTVNLLNPTAKGGLVSASAANTPGVLAVGADGTTLVANSSAATGLAWASNFAAGKNKILNADMGISQRGTTFTNPATAAYTLDRYFVAYDGTGATRTISQQTFTPATAPVSGYESTSYYRYAMTVAGTGNTQNQVHQKIEDVRQLAGQQFTFSFWGKADSARTVNLEIDQNFGAGGSTAVAALASTPFSLTTSWQRFSVTATMPSISGKTIGTSSYLDAFFYLPAGVTMTVDLWGWQLEAAPVATSFQTATGTLQGELAACQRYYTKFAAASASYYIGGVGNASSTTTCNMHFAMPVQMRINPTSIDYSNLCMYDEVTNPPVSLATVSTIGSSLYAGATFTGTLLTQYRSYNTVSGASTAGYIGFSAEL